MKRFIFHDTKKVEIQEFGNKGRVLVLLSGWPHDFQLERLFCQKLALYYRVFTISYPGYFGSEENPKSQSCAYISGIIDTLAEAEHLKKFTLVGFSAGCQVALQYLKNHKEVRAVLLSPVMHSLKAEAPYWGKVLLLLPILLSIIRLIDPLKLLVVNYSYSRISPITEGIAGSSKLSLDRISLNGAFDTLIAAVTTFLDPVEFRNRVSFIFGEREVMQSRLNALNINYHIIKDAGHGYIEKNYKEIVQLIRKIVK